MDFMKVICDYAKTDACILMYRVEHIATDVFTTYEDIDEDCFRLNIFPMGEVISEESVLKIADAVRDYLFDE